MSDRQLVREKLLREAVEAVPVISGKRSGDSWEAVPDYGFALRKIAGVRCPLCGPDADDDGSQWCGRHEHGECCAEYARAVLARFDEK